MLRWMRTILPALQQGWVPREPVSDTTRTRVLYVIAQMRSGVQGVSCQESVRVRGERLQAEQQQRQQQWLADARSNCAIFGFSEGTPEFSRCVQDTYNTSMLADQQERSAAATAGAIIAAQPAQAPSPQQTVTRCVTDGLGVERCRSD